MLLLAIVVALGAQDCRAIKEKAERLDCYDAQNALVDERQGEFERQKAAVDAMLAKQLRDPLSAIDYQVSDELSCDGVGVLPGQGKRCICYSVNAKNAMGGYTGAVMDRALLHRVDDELFVALPARVPLSAEDARYCLSAGNMAPRPAARIAELIER